ncbi:MAG: C4-type zinc ribbon domain-containing protein [candidate division KSB1 bacterium]|nr:C4-type zinc ribbon domain-containing protein [candidate division KSB1 bacterium]
MVKKELELLVALQDLDMMLSELTEVEKLGFDVKGKDKLQEAREELVSKISKPLVYSYEKLRQRYKRAIVPVKGDACLGCFMRLPTSLSVRGRDDSVIHYCEGCGRILYWLE